MPTSITLQQLQYFLSAVEHGSLSAAADAHFIAQPSLSEQIRRLENQLGTTLFVRTNRKLILTEAAQMLIPHAQRTLAAAEEAAQAVSPITPALLTRKLADKNIRVTKPTPAREAVTQRVGIGQVGGMRSTPMH